MSDDFANGNWPLTVPSDLAATAVVMFYRAVSPHVRATIARALKPAER